MAEEKAKPQARPAAAEEQVVEQTDVTDADLGKPYGSAIRKLAEDLPEKDEVQKAYEAGFLADSQQEEARQKVKVVEASPDAAETPSGYALKKVAGVSHDTERGEQYAREKTARRWGYVPADE